MRRPRHREKSRTLWTTLLIAALVNIVLLWPVLARLSVFAGIRREVLIPVTLTSLPPSHKLPDTLTRVPLPQSGLSAPPASPSHITEHTASLQPSSARIQAPAVGHPSVVSAALPLAASAAAHRRDTLNGLATKRIASAKPAERSPIHVTPSVMKREASRPHPSVPPAPTRRSTMQRVAQLPEHDSTGDHSRRDQIRARIARANHLQVLGQQVAERIAADEKRNAPSPKPATKIAALPNSHTDPTQVAALPTPTQPVSTDVPSVVNTLPKEAPTSPVLPQPNLTPAVALVQVHPTIPDAMQTSAWHATFHGRFYIHSDGSLTVVMVSSTGFHALDQRALSAARSWKFKPAYQGKAPVASTRDFVIDYAVRADTPNITGN